MDRAKDGGAAEREIVVMPGTTLRVMTWNIHGAHGRNPRFDIERVIELIRRHAPDVVALQEVDSRRPRAAGVDDPFEVLQRALGNHGVGAKAITTADGEYGQAIISRWPIRDVLVRDISYREREPRRAIRCDIVAPVGPLRVVATHLGLSIGERREQVRALLELTGRTSQTTVVLGDFNDWFLVGSVRKALAVEFPARSRIRTFPSRYPVFRFDRIYCRPVWALANARTDRAAQTLSDHLPVIAEVRIGG
jgi:endonuclease/exonuclease/phosphatase family metal-dependent hydrolase